jgi:hypothetical protein
MVTLFEKPKLAEVVFCENLPQIVPKLPQKNIFGFATSQQSIENFV